MELDLKKISNILNGKKVVIPTIVGLGITFFLLIHYNKLTLESIQLLKQADWRYLIAVVGTIVLRDLGYTWRVRVIANNRLTWLSSFYITILWEFSSAVTPSVIGGGIAAIFVLVKEGVRLGKAIAYVMLAGILDNLFFIFIASLGGYSSLFTTIEAIGTHWSSGLQFTFWTGYTIITVYTVFTIIGLVINPQIFKKLLLRCTSIRFLKRWRPMAYTHSKDIVLASQTFQQKPIAYWLKLGAATLCSWAARYLLLNFLIAAYLPLNWGTHIAIIKKQVIMWAIMLVPLSPGGSGIAEFCFQKFYSDILGTYTLLLDIIWRGLTYYLYLILGVVCLQRWLKKVSSK